MARHAASSPPEIGADELPASNNASLSNLTLSAGTLDTPFNANTLNYGASVGNAVGTMTVSALKAEANASVGITPANPSTLAVGANGITVLVTAQDGTPKTYVVTVTRRTAFQDWALTNGVGSDPNAPGANGLANLLNFGFGLTPSQGNAAMLLPQPQASGGNYVITFTQPAGVSGVTYGAEWKADLSSGTWTPIGDSGTGTTHTFSVPIGSNPQIFMRLKVSSP